MFGFPSWKSSDPKIIGIKTDLFENFSQKKRLPKILGDLFRVKICYKWTNIPFLGGSKILGEAGKQEIYNKCSENSRSEIVFRTDIFRKLTLGAPAEFFQYRMNIKRERILSLLFHLYIHLSAFSTIFVSLNGINFEIIILNSYCLFVMTADGDFPGLI